MVACGGDDPNPGTGGAGGNAEGGGGAGAGGNAEGGGGAGAGAGGNAEGGGGAGSGGNAEGGGGAGSGGNAEDGGGAGSGGNAEGGGGAGAGGNAEGGGGAGSGGNAEGGGGAGSGGNAEGGGGAGSGGNAEGGGGADGGLDRTELAIAADEDGTAGCATFVDGVWGVDETEFFGGEPTNYSCALVPVLVDGDAYWISSRDFAGTIDAYDLNYSFLSAAARIEETSSSFILLDTAFEEIFSGILNVTSLTDDSVTLSIE
ncbi:MULTISPECIES: hypothetical protein [Sorangium]|uniref:hypothetical protein n=1 Tax=Sorangium TaxID=39643 RepID=UPI00101A07E0|nr:MULTISPECIES: hypothetical protein [Sorangium]